MGILNLYMKNLFIFKTTRTYQHITWLKKFMLTISKNGLEKIQLNGYGSIKDGEYNFYFLINISPSCILTENSSMPFNVFRSLIRFFLYFKMELPFFKFFSTDEF